MRAVVCGGRSVTDKQAVFRNLDRIHAERRITVVIEGGQRSWKYGNIVGGVDWFAHEWAVLRGIPIITEPAKWDDMSEPCQWGFRKDGTKYNRLAGPRRNEKMAEVHKPDIVIAFPGASGTANMIFEAKLRSIEVLEVKWEDCKELTE